MKDEVPFTIWIGLIKVEQLDRGGPLGDADRAYTNVIGIARNKVHFRKLIENSLNDLELKLLRLESPETLEQRTKKYSVHNAVLKLAETLDSDNPIAFDVFATFDA